ncbi:MAG: DUF4760 domain-containing protein [Candidatus Thiodiazotropha endolucinida]
MGIYEIVDIIFNITVFYAVVIGLYVYLRSLRQKRRTVSLEYIKRWNQDQLNLIFSQLVGESRTSNKNLREALLDWSQEGSSSKQIQELEKVWNFFEELALAILFREADEEIAKEFFYYSLLSTYKLSGPVIDSLREKTGNRGLYANIERLYGKWSFDKEYTVIREVSK